MRGIGLTHRTIHKLRDTGTTKFAAKFVWTMGTCPDHGVWTPLVWTEPSQKEPTLPPNLVPNPLAQTNQSIMEIRPRLLSVRYVRYWYRYALRGMHEAPLAPSI